MRAQHPFEDLRYARPTLRLTFQEGIQLLIDAGYDGEVCRTLKLLLLLLLFVPIHPVRDIPKTIVALDCGATF